VQEEGKGERRTTGFIANRGYQQTFNFFFPRFPFFLPYTFYNFKRLLVLRLTTSVYSTKRAHAFGANPGSQAEARAGRRPSRSPSQGQRPGDRVAGFFPFLNHHSSFGPTGRRFASTTIGSARRHGRRTIGPLGRKTQGVNKRRDGRHLSQPGRRPLPGERLPLRGEGVQKHANRSITTRPDALQALLTKGIAFSSFGRSGHYQPEDQ
jgi:hypothetical protein